MPHFLIMRHTNLALLSLRVNAGGNAGVNAGGNAGGNARGNKRIKIIF
jgi:hypothetical protein